MTADEKEKQKKELKMAGRGSLSPPIEPTQISGASYWKSYGLDGSSLLLDESERKKHVKDYGLEAHSKKDLRGKKRLDRRQLGSGSSTAKYVPRMR